MVSLRLLFLTTSLFVSQGYSQLTSGPRPCGPMSVTPTGPIIHVGHCIVPAIIKPLVTPCQPLPTCQPLPPCLPTPPTLPTQPCHPAKPAPSVEDDDDENLDKILCLLINNILENRKNSGKKSGSGKGIESDNGIDSSNNYVDCGEDYEYILPSPYAPYQTPASATFYPYGAGAGECAPTGSGNGPEINLIFRPLSDSC